MLLNKAVTRNEGLHDGSAPAVLQRAGVPGSEEGNRCGPPGSPANAGPTGQEQLLKLADLENELQGEISLESFLSGFKLAPGIAAELAPSCFFHDEEEQLACEALRQRKGK